MRRKANRDTDPFIRFCPERPAVASPSARETPTRHGHDAASRKKKLKMKTPCGVSKQARMTKSYWWFPGLPTASHSGADHRGVRSWCFNLDNLNQTDIATCSSGSRSMQLPFPLPRMYRGPLGQLKNTAAHPECGGKPNLFGNVSVLGVDTWNGCSRLQSQTEA
jgi:hypothetical protein